MRLVSDIAIDIFAPGTTKARRRPVSEARVGAGDKEKLVVDGEQIYRLHIGRTHTAFYLIEESENEVRVVEVLDIDEAYEQYGCS